MNSTFEHSAKERVKNVLIRLDYNYVKRIK